MTIRVSPAITIEKITAFVTAANEHNPQAHGHESFRACVDIIARRIGFNFEDAIDFASAKYGAFLATEPNVAFSLIYPFGTLMFIPIEGRECWTFEPAETKDGERPDLLPAESSVGNDVSIEVVAGVNNDLSLEVSVGDEDEEAESGETRLRQLYDAITSKHASFWAPVIVDMGGGELIPGMTTGAHAKCAGGTERPDAFEIAIPVPDQYKAAEEVGFSAATWEFIWVTKDRIFTL